MEFKVVYKVFLSMFSKKVELDVARIGRPLEIKKRSSYSRQFRPTGSRVEHALDQGIIVAT